MPTTDSCYDQKFLDFFVPGPDPVGCTDIMQYMEGIADVGGAGRVYSNLPSSVKAEVERKLARPGSFPSGRDNLRMFC